MQVLEELQRRRVFQVAAVYIVVAWVVVQVADNIFPGLGVPESSIIYVWMAAAIGLPFALFFGWRYDLVDGRILRTAAADGESGAPIGGGDKATLAVMSAVLLAICVGLTYEISKTRIDDPGRPRLANAAPNSVAVLPFANFGGAQENEYLADGLTETLLHALAQASGLKVTARTSSFFYKGKDIDVRDIAAELGVSKVLEGSVQQSGDKIRIVAQLIEADTGFHLWSNTYDQDLGDIFTIQDSIASNVAIAILATLTAAPGLSETKLTGVSTTSLEAYQNYLHGLEQARISSNLSLPKADALFKQALVIDPDFFEALKELAFNTYQMMRNGTIPASVAIERLGPLADRLLEMRPDDGASIALNGRIRFFSDPESVDNEDFIAELMAAIDRNPNETFVYSYLATVLFSLGRPDESIEWLNRAITVDPLDYELHRSLGDLLANLGDHRAEIEAFERVTEINPEYPSGYSSLGWAKWRIGDHVGWYQGMSRAAELDPLDHEMEMGLTQGLIGLGLIEEAKKHAARASEINAANGGEWSLSSRLSLLGDPAESRALTESFLRRELPERGWGHAFPAMAYVTASIDAGKAQEALALFEEIRPGITGEDFKPTSVNEFTLHSWATVAWAHGKEISEVSVRLDLLTPRWRAVAPWLDEFWYSSVAFAFLRGDMEEATRLSIESMTNWMGTTEPFTFRHIYPYKHVAEQPAVAARLAEIEEAKLPGKLAVQAYIADNE